MSRFALIDNKERRLRDTHIRSRPAGVSLTSDTLGVNSCFPQENSVFYRTVSIAASALYSTLFVCLLVAPGSIYWLFGVERHTTADLLAKRAAMLFLGLAVLSFLGRNEPYSNLRQMVLVAMATSMAGLMLTGMYEFFLGTAGIGIWSAIGGEALFLSLYLLVLLRDAQQPKDSVEGSKHNLNTKQAGTS